MAHDDGALLASWLRLAGVGDAEARDLALAPLEIMAFERFDATTAGARMQADPPAWLERMLASPRHRKLFYRLCEQYPNCPLLQHGTSQLLNTKHAAEVARNARVCAALTTGASSLPAFVDAFGAQLCAHLQGEAGAADALSGICANEVPFLASQIMLAAVAPRLPIGERLQRVRASIADDAARAHGVPARRLQLLASGVALHSAPMRCLLSILSERAISAADARALHTAALGGAEALAALRQPALLQLLLQGLFDPTRSARASRETRELLLDVVVAVAISAEDPPGDPAARSRDLLDALRRAVELCARNEVTDVGVVVPQLAPLCAERAVGCGVLLWVHANLTHPQQSAARFNAVCLPLYLHLVVAVAREHRALATHACGAVVDFLRIEPADEADALAAVALKRQLVGVLLLLLARGCVSPVLAAFEDYLGVADLSLVRHCVLQLTALVAPPFSAPFGASLGRIARTPRVAEAFAPPAHRAVLRRLVDELEASASRSADSAPTAEALAAMSALAGS